MRAIRRFTVRTVLPVQLQPLAAVATNLRWSWHPETQDLFARIDSALWDEVGHDPVRLLGEVSAERLAVGWLERRTPEEMEVYGRIMAIAHAIIAEAFSAEVITPGATTTEDVVWWMR